MLIFTVMIKYYGKVSNELKTVQYHPLHEDDEIEEYLTRTHLLIKDRMTAYMETLRYEVTIIEPSVQQVHHPRYTLAMQVLDWLNDKSRRIK